MSYEVNRLLGKLPPYRGEQKLVTSRQDTFDIIREILKMHAARAKEYDKICIGFWQGDPEATARYIYNFSKTNLPYKVEPSLQQSVKSPAAILSERLTFGNDCKHYASMAVGIGEALRRLGFPVKCFYRFASYNPRRKAPGHVFAVFVINGKEYWVDPVPEMKGFNARNMKPYTVIDKMPPMSKNRGGIGSLYEISGVPVSTEQTLGSMDPTVTLSGHRGHWFDKYYGPRQQQCRQYRPKPRGMMPGQKPMFRGGMPMQQKPMMHGYDADMNGYDEMGKAKKKGFLKKLKIKVPKIKPGQLLKKFGGAPSRNAFLLLVKLNTFHLATKMWQKAARDKNSANWKKLAAKWEQLGGKADKLYREIQRGVNTYNKLHKAKKKISGYDDPMVMGYNEYVSGIEYIDGIDESVGEVTDMIGAYSDNMSVGEILCFVHDNHHHRMRRIGVAPAAAAAGVIAAAAPIIKALANVLKSFGINTKKADDTAAADTEKMADEYNKGEANPDGSVTTKDGKNIEVTDNADGTQTMKVKKLPGLSDKDQEEADGDGETYTKTKTVTKTKTKKTSGGDDDGEETSITNEKNSGAGFLDGIKNFVVTNKKWFFIGGGVLAAVLILPPLVRSIRGGGTTKRRR